MHIIFNLDALEIESRIGINHECIIDEQFNGIRSIICMQGIERLRVNVRSHY